MADPAHPGTGMPARLPARRGPHSGLRPRRSRLLLAGLALLALLVTSSGATSSGATSSGAATTASGQSAAGGQRALPSVGQIAPDGAFTAASGKTRRVASLRGHPTLVWFVATWCPSCQAGTQTMAQNINKLQAHGVRVVELKLHGNLGGPNTGPDADMTHFAHRYAGKAATSPGWTFGTASAQLTRRYDPQSYLDIYYLLDKTGHIRYINSSPASTMPHLLSHAGKLG